MYMCKQKIVFKDEKKIEIINIYDDNGKNFEDILTKAIKSIKIDKQWLSNTTKVKKGDF